MTTRSNKKPAGLAGLAALVVQSVKDALTGGESPEGPAPADFVAEAPGAASGAVARPGRKAPAHKLTGRRRAELAAKARRKRAL